MSQAITVLQQPLADLLCSGGDHRLALDPHSGLNHYGAGPTPRPEVVAFGSCSASSPTLAVWQAAERLRAHLLTANEPDAAAEAAAETIRQALITTFHLAPPAPAVALTTSGTDAEYLALNLALSQSRAPLCTVILAPSEVGSGTLAAASGRHVTATPPWPGPPTVPGNLLAGLPVAHLHHRVVELRLPDGRARAVGEVDEAVSAVVDDEVAKGRHVLVHQIADSKTGLAGPRDECLIALRARYGERLHLVIDGTQSRFPADRMARWQAWGAMVIVTGSKFFAGPPFAGALLVPESVWARAAKGSGVLPGLRRYICAHDLPPAWSSWRQELIQEPNFGLLLRWQAAIANMQAYDPLSDAQRAQAQTRFDELVRATFGEAVIAPPGDTPRTILPITLTAMGQPLDLAALRRLHHWLNADCSAWIPASGDDRQWLATPYHLGQPMELAGSSERAVLRIALGAPLAVALATNPEGAARLATHLAGLQRKIALLTPHLLPA